MTLDETMKLIEGLGTQSQKWKEESHFERHIHYTRISWGPLTCLN